MPPVPVYVKGGVWTNLEDQIVKAAIQKYGTHQWSKVASLLQRKSAKQCQIRWDEYLNPWLNFKEFSKQEDAKLLELARKLPNQWRTISDIMGRTTQLCIERYNKLLEGDELGVSTSLEFKVGEINPNAETQVAKPDGTEMEDEEREMLAEARARLLNTQGKKSTRKVRERMLEESKRIAQLQKRRELKQAGVRTDIKKPRKRYATEIDYNEDVVYEQPPLPGIYDTSLEDQRMAARIENFEKNVSLRGLRETGTHDPDRRKRRPSIPTSSHKILEGPPNEFKKPKLELPKPGTQINAEQLVRVNKSALVGVPEPVERTGLSKGISPRRTLTSLFASLPPPKNDFEILLEDELEFEDQNMQADPREDEQKLIVREEAISSLQPLPLECLTKRAPEFIQHPRDAVEQTFNELVASSSIQQPFLQPHDIQGFLDQIEVRMQDVSVERENLQWELPPARAVVDSINAQMSAINDLQSNLKFVQPLVKYNEKLCEKLCSSELPQMRSLQQRYYVEYQVYQSELQAIERKKTTLYDDMKGAKGGVI